MMHTTASGEDTLTGLPQHDAFVVAFEEAVAGAADSGGAVSMALVDIDHFARLNGDHGFEAGDRVLKAFAQFLRDMFRDRGRVFRYGGDAFAVLLPGSEKEEAFLLMEEARRGMSREREVGTEEGTVTLTANVTIGVAAYPDDGVKVAEIARKGNEAVYRAKVGGANKVCLAREEKMVTKTSHYTQGQLHGLSRLAKREGVGEAVLLREALDDLFRKHNS